MGLPPFFIFRLLSDVNFRVSLSYPPKKKQTNNSACITLPFSKWQGKSWPLPSLSYSSKRGKGQDQYLWHPTKEYAERAKQVLFFFAYTREDRYTLSANFDFFFFRVLFNAKAILVEKQHWYYLTCYWKHKGIHTFPNGINTKLIIIVRLEFDLTSRPQYII